MRVCAPVHLVSRLVGVHQPVTNSHLGGTRLTTENQMRTHKSENGRFVEEHGCSEGPPGIIESRLPPRYRKHTKLKPCPITSCSLQGKYTALQKAMNGRSPQICKRVAALCRSPLELPTSKSRSGYVIKLPALAGAVRCEKVRRTCMVRWLDEVRMVN